MLSRISVRVICLLGLVPASALALGLGDIHLRSALNAPLNAEIDLTATAEELASLRTAISNRDTFARYGLDYPAFLANATVQAEKLNGRDILRVRSPEAITEPFITLLIDASWARGRAVREYTVLLDPPVFTERSQAPAVAEAAATAPQRAGAVDRTATTSRATQPAPAAAAPASAAAGSSSAAGATYSVRSGDTLSGIASGRYPGVSRERALVAIYRANPQAFAGNMNELRAGAQLTLPAEADVAAVAPGAAISEVSQQYQAWARTRSAAGGEGQLRLVPPQDAPVPTAAAGNATAPAAGGLQQRVTELERQLVESRRLLELRNAELARLQAQVAGGTPAAPSAPPAAQPLAPAPEAAPAEAATAETPAPVAAEQPAPPAAAAAPPVAPAAEEPSSGSWLDALIERWYLLAGLVVLVLAMLGWRSYRARQAREFEHSLDRLGGASFERASNTSATMPVRSLPDTADDSFLVEESGSRERPRFEPTEAGFSPAAKAVAVDDTVSGDTAVGLEQGDPLAEADFHMAYGLYDQAADLVRLAISREPQRRELKLKLLEVYFVWGNKDQFLPLARELSESRAQALPGEWEKIVIMGRQIAPDDSLFPSGGISLGAAGSSVDLNLEGGQNRIDFDLLGEPTMAASGGEAVDLDLGAALRNTGAETGALAADAGVDFVLDDPARGGDDVTGSTREMPEGASPQHTITMELSGLEGDASTVEQPRLEETDNPTIRQKLDAQGRQALTGAEQTTELALDDLGLDLGTMEVGAPEASGDATDDAPTVLARVDEETRRLRSRADTASTLTGSVPSLTPSTSGTWLFTDDEVAAIAPPDGQQPTQIMPSLGHDATELLPMVESDNDLTSVTGRLQALKDNPGEMDLDLGGLAATGGHETSSDGNGLDLDLGAQSPAAETGYSDTQRLSAVETVLPDLEPPTMSEVGTKLDLARAYMDMGDPEGARSILDEVLHEGSASQKQEARRLIESLPG